MVAHGTCSQQVKALRESSVHQACGPCARCLHKHSFAYFPTIQAGFALARHIAQDLVTVSNCVQFINTLEANIFTTLSVVANVTINNVTPGSIKVDNSVAFTGGDATAASAAQAKFASLLESQDANDLASVYGTSFGIVSVSGITKTNSTNPSKCFPIVDLYLCLEPWCWWFTPAFALLRQGCALKMCPTCMTLSCMADFA